MPSEPDREGSAYHLENSITSSTPSFMRKNVSTGWYLSQFLLDKLFSALMFSFFVRKHRDMEKTEGGDAAGSMSPRLGENGK